MQHNKINLVTDFTIKVCYDNNIKKKTFDFKCLQNE